MARPLTNSDSGGALYARPSMIEAQIDEAVSLSRAGLQDRLRIADSKAPGYLRSECLVHLIREGRRSDEQLMNAVLPVLLGRCEANLLTKVPDTGTRDAASLRQKILENLIDLFLTDGSGDFPNELDFYECRFNKAFMTLRIDAVRREVRRRHREIEVVDVLPEEADGEADSYDEVAARLSDAFECIPPQEWHVFGEPFVKAIEALPYEEREAVILVHVFGYKEESEDPDEETAATRCNCTGRTIRNRLKRAAAKLSRFKEDL